MRVSAGCPRSRRLIVRTSTRRLRASFDRERDRDLGLGDEHGAGFGDGGTLPLPGREEPVFGPGRFGSVEASHDPYG